MLSVSTLIGIVASNAPSNPRTSSRDLPPVRGTNSKSNVSPNSQRDLRTRWYPNERSWNSRGSSLFRERRHGGARSVLAIRVPVTQAGVEPQREHAILETAGGTTVVVDDDAGNSVCARSRVERDRPVREEHSTRND